VTRGAGGPPAGEPAARILAFGLLLPLAAGAACVFGFAPFHAWVVPIIALAALFHAWTRSRSVLQAALSGFAFGLGYFLTGVSWVYVSLHDFGGMPAILAALATFLFCAYLAIFPAGVGALLARWFPAARARLIAAPALFVLLEWVRGWLFTGFPWLTLGTSQIPASPLAGFAPYVGAYGTSLAVAGAAAIVAALAGSRGWSHARAGLATGLAAVFLAGAGARVPVWTEPAGPPVSMALLQGNVPQELKWQEEVRTRTLLAYRQMIFDARGRVVVIPETALPAFLDQLPAEYLESLRAHARETGKEILLGTVEREFQPGGEYRYYNSLVRLTGAGNATFRKRHLVPFGEFIPPGFRWVLAVLHIPLSDFSRGAEKQAPIVAAGVPFGVAICYEDIFGEEVIDLLPQSQVIVNVSNDAWFGKSFAAEQHLQASQMRALETGRWVVRSTNTGATAAIDTHGRVVSQLEPFTSGTLVADVVPMRGSTPYARVGNWGALALLAIVLGFAIRRRR
jgi:apolipoprotein N-acyltransferase